MYLPKRLELSFRLVLALPKAFKKDSFGKYQNQEAIREYTVLEVLVSCICEDFLRQARVTDTVLFIVLGWLKWVKKETWSHSGCCLECK